MEPKDLVGCIVRTSAGALKITSARFSRIITDKSRSITKIVKIKCQCGLEFESTMDALESVVIPPKESTNNNGE